MWQGACTSCTPRRSSILYAPLVSASKFSKGAGGMWLEFPVSACVQTCVHTRIAMLSKGIATKKLLVGI